MRPPITLLCYLVMALPPALAEALPEPVGPRNATPILSQAPHDSTQHGHGQHGTSRVTRRPGGGMRAMPATMAHWVGLLGPYPRMRESSGTAWQPDLASHHAIHKTRGPWTTMIHGFATAVYDHQGGERGDDDVFGASMLMGVLRRSLDHGTLGFRAMLSGDPVTIGKEGYPLLLQTGETADGRTPLIDRQHPHDFFMELAATYRLAKDDKGAFLYVGMPGEPALGPPAFMHRFSGAASPFAPISHHWLDSTHITYGVATFGLVAKSAKLEGSVFTGREPDEDRWGWDEPDIDSHSFRASLNPGRRLSLQVSFGELHSPEELHPDQDIERTTASIAYNHPRKSGETQVTGAWGRNRVLPGETTDMFLLEGAMSVGERSTFFARAERGQKNELFPEDDPRAEEIFDVTQLSGGYVREILTRRHASLGLGGSVGVSLVARELKEVYGDAPFSGAIFLRGLLQ